MKFLIKKIEVPYLIKVFIGFMLAHCTLASCNKDLGDYDYTELNTASVSGLDSIYEVLYGEQITIKPTITFSKDASPDTANYKYEWLLFNRDGYTQGIPEKLDSAQTFNFKATKPIALYHMVFRITDKSTGVWQQFPFKLLVSAITYEGWLALSDISKEQSRLDMLSYSLAEEKYTVYTDILKQSGSTLQLTGTPSFVYYMSGPIGPSGQNSQDKIIVSTSDITTYIGSDTLEYKNEYALKNWMPSDAVFSGTDQNMWGGRGHSSVFTYTNKNVYLYNSSASSSSFYRMSPINKMYGSSNYFKASKFYASDLSKNKPEAILYNEDESQFVWYSGESSTCSPIDNKTLSSITVDKELLFLKYSALNGGKYVAILKDKVKNSIFLVRFNMENQLDYHEILNTPIAQASQFDINNDYGYIFYTVGGKLYEYDGILKTNKEMADYGTKKISYIQSPIVGRYNGYEENQRYINMRRKLVVCSYDESDLNSSGTIDIYKVPPINGQIEKEESYSGFGKIVSLTYRSR